MKRLSFLVIRGENDCFMVHGLDWATYAEGMDWLDITKTLRSHIDRAFIGESHPEFLDFRFPDGRIISLGA